MITRLPSLPFTTEIRMLDYQPKEEGRVEDHEAKGRMAVEYKVGEDTTGGRRGLHIY